MLKDISRARLLKAWCAAVVVIAACAVVLGAAVTVGNFALLLVTCLVPLAVMLILRPVAEPMSVAELLHSVNRPSNQARP